MRKNLDSFSLISSGQDLWSGWFHVTAADGSRQDVLAELDRAAAVLAECGFKVTWTPSQKVAELERDWLASEPKEVA